MFDLQRYPFNPCWSKTVVDIPVFYFKIDHICLEVYPSAWKFIYLPENLSICLEVHPSAWKFIHLPGSSSICLEVYPSAWKFYLSAWMFIHLPGSLSICLENRKARFLKRQFRRKHFSFLFRNKTFCLVLFSFPSCIQ